MSDINYFSGIVKILENPKKKFVKNKTLLTTVRVEVPQMRQNQLVTLVFWGILADEIKKSYRKHDYLLIDGYISTTKKKLKLKKIVITVLKVYPLLLEARSLPKKN